MGYFSKTCAKTHLPVVVEALDLPRLNIVVALMPDGRKFEGAYDGYGRVGGKNVLDKKILYFAEEHTSRHGPAFKHPEGD